MKFNFFICGICLFASQLSAQVAEQATKIIPDSLAKISKVIDSTVSPVNNISQDSDSISEADSSLDTVIKPVDGNSDYAVAAFINDERSFPQEPDKYIDVLKDSTSLTQLDSFPDTISSGILILRRRFGPAEYSLYLGVTSDYAKMKQSNFFIYNFSDSLSLKKVVTLKFYDDKVENPNGDIENIYFDNNHIYIPKLSKIYYHIDSSWKMITATNAVIIKKKTTGDISITSTPAGANVAVDGKESGKLTPYISGSMKPGKHSVFVTLKDYAKETKDVDIKADTVIQVNFDLKSTIGLEHKYFISLFFNPEYYFNISPTKSTDDNWKAGLRKDSTIRSVTTPSNNIGIGVTLQAVYRLKNKLWLTGRILYSHYKLDDYMFVRDTRKIDREYEKWQSSRTTSIFGIAPGISYDAFRSPFYQLSFSIAPEYAYVVRDLHTTDSSIIESSIKGENENIIAYRVTKTISESRSNLSGSAFGGDFSIDSKFFVKRNICIDVQLGFNSVIAPSLKGKRHYTEHSVYSNPAMELPDLVNDTSWTDKIAALKGNYFGTGNVIIYDNPDYYKDFRKAYIELTKILLRIGICFYF